MNRRTKFLILTWFIFSWLTLIVFTLKPIGAINTIKSIIRPLIRSISVPEELILCDFEESGGFSKWYWTGTFMEPSKDHARRGKYSAKITYYAKQEVPSAILEDYNLGPMEVKDWSLFNFLKFSIFNPQNIDLPLYIKIKDIAGRAIDRVLDLKSGENEITFNLEDIGQFIDLANIIYLNFYFINPGRDITLYFDDIHLERGDLRGKRILDKPIVNFIRLSCPKEANKNDSVMISAFLSMSKELRNNFRVFIHISYSKEINKRPAQRRWFINADRDPWIPTSTWMINTPYEIGPISLYIPKNFPSGDYLIQIGLFNSASGGSYCRFSSNRGMMDFRTSFPKLRYADPKIKDYIVGKIRVLP